MAAPLAVHLLPGLGVGGTERLVLELCAGIDPARVRQEIVLSRATSVTPWWPAHLDPSVPVHVAAGRGGAVLERLRPDVVHVLYWGIDDPAQAAAVRSRAVPAVVSVTDGHRPLGGPAVAATVFCCRAQRDAVAGSVAGPVVIHNGISPVAPVTPAEQTAARRRLGLPARGPVVTSIARLHHDKVNAAGAGAALHLARLRPDVHVLVLGSGDRLAHWRRRVGEAGMGDRIRLLGLTPHPRDHLAAADLFLHPVRRDTFPYAVLEALGCGLPVAALDLPGLREMCGGAAVYADSPERLGAAAAALLDDPPRRARLAARAPGRAARFGAARTAAAYARLFRSVSTGTVHSTSP